MDQDELIQIIKDYMLENKVGYIWFSAATNIKRSEITYQISEEKENDIEDYGFKC